MVTIFVDGKKHEVEEDQNLLRAVLGLGYDLPYFCWHPALHSVGACRQCAVKQFRDADDTTGMIVMACTTPVSEGLRISIDDPEAREFRASVIEWYMTNHPHDCPICDEGGECHLQDMTVMAGHRVREHRFNKRTFRNQNLGPFINHEMNRCIQCYRCVRFYRNYAGGADLNVFGSRNRVYFGRVSDGTLESPFSGNLVEICPTGVFTDKIAMARSVRPWDLQTAPSICGLCGLGCNTHPGERNGALRRVRNRYHGEINRYFLCDRGRFGFEFVNSPRRLQHPAVRTNGHPDAVSADQAVDHIARLLSTTEAIGIGSPRASLESNFALRRLVGEANFYMGIGADEAARLQAVLDILRTGPARTPTLREVEEADAVFILGEDISNTAPMLELAVRQAVLNAPLEDAKKLGIPYWNDFFNRLVVNNRRGPLFIATPTPSALDGIATDVARLAPQDVARLGFAVASAVDRGSTLSLDLPPDVAHMIGPVSEALTKAAAPLIISGMGAADLDTIQAAGHLAEVLATINPKAALSLVVPDCNSVGAALLGARDLGAAGDAAAVETVIVLEPDPSTRQRQTELHAVVDRASHVVVLAHLEGPATAGAEVVLPAAALAECNGTLVNNEGRAQRFFQVFPPTAEIRASWHWLASIHQKANGRNAVVWADPDDVAKAVIDELPIFAPLAALKPTSGGRPPRRVPRQSHRVTGRTAINAHRDIREHKPPADDESPMAFSMEGSSRRPPSDLIARYWSPGWNSVQALTKFQEEIGGPLRGGDPGVILVETAPDQTGRPRHQAPDGFTPRDGEWLLIPIHHLFGSEALSMETPGVAERAPTPYIGLNPDDARGIGAVQGDILSLDIEGQNHRLPLQAVDGLPKGCAGLPEGLSEITVLPAGRWAKIRGIS